MDSELVDSKPIFTQTRCFSRLPTDLRIHLLTDELRVDDRITDLSEGGVGVMTHRPISPMSLVSFRIDLPHGAEPVELLGRVMWANHRAMGIRFEQPDARLSDIVWRLRQDYERI